jgi:hypothetical protein
LLKKINSAITLGKNKSQKRTEKAEKTKLRCMEKVIKEKIEKKNKRTGCGRLIAMHVGCMPVWPYAYAWLDSWFDT